MWHSILLLFVQRIRCLISIRLQEITLFSLKNIFLDLRWHKILDGKFGLIQSIDSCAKKHKDAPGSTNTLKTWVCPVILMIWRKFIKPHALIWTYGITSHITHTPHDALSAQCCVNIPLFPEHVPFASTMPCIIIGVRGGILLWIRWTMFIVLDLRRIVKWDPAPQAWRRASASSRPCSKTTDMQSSSLLYLAWYCSLSPQFCCDF